jgi:hypothetical protein
MAKALAAQGHGVVALVQFLQMLREGFWPDEVIFLGMINAWGHSMLVSKGRQFIQVYGRRVQHHTMDGFFFFGATGRSTAFSYRSREKQTVQEWHVSIMVVTCQNH